MSLKMKKVGRKGPVAKPRVRAGISEADVDAFVAEHEQALNASIKRGRAEVKKGIYSTRSVKDIAVAGTKRLRAAAGRAMR